MPLAVSQFEPPANFASNNLAKSGVATARRQPRFGPWGPSRSLRNPVGQGLLSARAQEIQVSPHRRSLTAVVLNRNSLGNYSDHHGARGWVVSEGRRDDSWTARFPSGAATRTEAGMFGDQRGGREFRRRNWPGTIVMSASPKFDPNPLGPLGPLTTLSRIAPTRAAEPSPHASFTPWLAVVLVVVLFSGGLFGYDQGVISGALAGIKLDVRAEFR